MSLVTTASTWISDDNSNKKKRIPSFKRTSTANKLMSHQNSEEINLNENFQAMSPKTIEDDENHNNDRNDRVSSLLDKMTNLNDDDNNVLGNFNPISPPSLNVKSDNMDDNDEGEYMPEIPRFKNKGTASNVYGANDMKSNVYSNYNKSYQAPMQYNNAPQYANMGIASGSGDNKMLEKINYMIHLLEQQQSEKTDNITEEFILYSFLGIFIIFVVDSFSRAGKYTR